MDITITIPDDNDSKILKGFTAQCKYPKKVNNDGEEIDNPESMKEFAADKMLEHFQETYVASQSKVFENQRAAVITTARAEANAITVTVK